MLTELAYCRDPSQLFSALAAQPWSIFLDSGHPYINHGRYDIIAADPYIMIKTFAHDTEILYVDGRSEHSTADPFAIIQSLLGESVSQLHTVPFAGGALGYFAYDLVRRIEALPAIAEHDIDMPDMAIGIYDWAVVTDHQQRRTWLSGYGKDERTIAKWDRLQEMFHRPSTIPASAIEKKPIPYKPQSNMDRTSYAHAFNKIKHYIRQGDCYQVNLAQRFSIDFCGDPWAAYRRLRRLNAAPFGSFFNIPEGAILSTSPERFLQVHNRLVESKPIKGTRPRSLQVHEDRALSEALLESTKDRAENLMIVDLIRNDIGKTCDYGSVVVPRLFALESFATVHHLVSTVIGRLASGADVLELLRGCFPGGSITGAPKIRAMEIIEELEPHRRSVYCGSIAYIGFDRNMDSNIIIRTSLYHRGKMHYWAGGGIIMDSKLDAEYQECLDKAAVFFSLFDTKDHVDH